MQIDTQKHDDILIVRLDGRLVAGTGAQQLEEAINRFVADDHEKILLDLSAVQRIDSSGIGELMQGRKLAQRFGCDLRLLNVEGQVHHVLEIGQLLPLFRVYSDETEALEDFAGD